MGPATEYLKEIHKRHRRNIENYLEGEPLHHNDLWLSVGYFWHGAGAHGDRSFVTDEQWKQLLIDTGRHQEASIL